MRAHIAEECKNDYAAQLQKYNKEQNQFYFNDMPLIFNVSELCIATWQPASNIIWGFSIKSDDTYALMTFQNHAVKLNLISYYFFLYFVTVEVLYD